MTSRNLAKAGLKSALISLFFFTSTAHADLIGSGDGKPVATQKQSVQLPQSRLSLLNAQLRDYLRKLRLTK